MVLFLLFENFFKIIYLFIYFWLCWVFVSVRGLSLFAASGGHSSSRCVGLSLSRPLLLWSTCSRRTGSVVVAHGPSCSAACGIFPDQGSNPCPLHWQADSQPLRHQGSPENFLLTYFYESLGFLRQGLYPCRRIHWIFFIEKKLGNFIKFMNYYKLHWVVFSNLKNCQVMKYRKNK